MPTSIGHALAGAATAWAADLFPARRVGATDRPNGPAEAGHDGPAWSGLALVCAGLAALPDADLLFHVHRTVTHSIGAVIARHYSRRRRDRAGHTRRSRRRRARGADLRRGLRDAPAARLAGDGPLSAVRHPGALAVQHGVVHLESGLVSAGGTATASSRGRSSATTRGSSGRNACASGRSSSASGCCARGRVARGPHLRRCRSVSTYRTPGRTSARGSRPRPSGGAADTAGTSDRRGRRAGR